MMKVYENVFKHNGRIYVREFNTETQEVFLTKSDVVLPFYTTSNNGNYIAYNHFNAPQKKLKRIDYDYKTYNIHLKDLKNRGEIPYGRANAEFEWIFQNYPNHFECIHKFHTWFFDIEVTGKVDEGTRKADAWKPEFAGQEITLIQVYDTQKEKFYIWTLKDYKGNLNLKNVKIFKLENERKLLLSFLGILNTLKPAIIVGWNTISYDYPYLTNRIAKVLDRISDLDDIEELTKGKNVMNLSPFGIVEKYQRKDEKLEYHWKGIILEDYMTIYKKYTFHTLDSYSLNSVCEYELGQEKISHDEFSDFAEFYEKDFNKFFEYGIKDIELLLELDKKLKLLDLCAFIAYMCGVCIPDVRGTLKQWNNYVYNEAFKRNIILPQKSLFHKEDVKFIGGIVHSTTNKWDWVASFDFTSLYPSLISFLNLGGDTLYIPKSNETDLLELQKKQQELLEFAPEIDTQEVKTKILDYVRNILMKDENYQKHTQEILQKYNVVMGANGSFFTNSKKSLFAELIENLLVERQRMKKLMKSIEKEIEVLKSENKDYSEKSQLRDYYDINQQALKVLANSAYGILSMEACIFCGSNKWFSNAITTTGQVYDVLCAITAGETMEKINQKLETPLKDKSKEGLKWIAACDTDSLYVSLEPFVAYAESKKS